MQRAASEADRTIMVLSPDYLKSQFASPEWAAAFAQDPQGIERKLLPIVVRKCNAPGLLKSVVHIDLSEADEDGASQRLLDGVNAKRAKTLEAPPVSRPKDESSAQAVSWSRLSWSHQAATLHTTAEAGGD